MNLDDYSHLLMGLYQNKHGDWITPRPPSPYGYALGQRLGTWCKKCADRYWLYKAYKKCEGTRDSWFFITRDNLNLNFQCSLCRTVITDFSLFKLYKRWNWYNSLYYICKDFKDFLYKCRAYKIISKMKRRN